MSVVSAQSGLAARTGKPFTFQRTRSGTTEEFYPAAGARLRFASCDKDTLSLPGLPVGLLTTDDVVTVQYNGTTVFKGTVATRIERQGRGTDRVEDVTVEGPWGLMARLVFRQEWKVTGSGGTVGENTSHLILNQSSLGVLQNVTAQIQEIAKYAAGYCGFTYAAANISAGTTQLPPDEARDLTCAAAIMRELRYFPQTICRFDYSGTPALHVSVPPDETPQPAGYLSLIPKTQRSYTRTSHPVVGVDICTQDWDVVTGNNNVDSTMRAFSHQEAGIVNSIDTLHVYMPLAPGNSSKNWESLDVETIPDGQSYTSINFWIRNHPALSGLTYSQGNTNGISAFGPITPNPLPNNCPRLTDTTVGDLRRFGLNAEVVRLTCPVTITTPEKVEQLVLTLDYVATNATTRTYTKQTGSSSTAAETLPEGLAQAILDQRGGELMSEDVTIRLGDSFPTIGDADVVTENNVSQVLYLQNFEVDCYDLTATLHFGRPAFLSPEDMRDLLLGFRQRGFAANVPNRAEPDADDNMEDVGGVQPLKSSSTTISSIAKATVKTTGGGTIKLDTTSASAGTVTAGMVNVKATSGGAIDIKTSDVGSGNTAKFQDLKYTDSTGRQMSVKVLSTDEVTIPAGGAPSGVDQTVVSGVSFDFDPSTGQLKATLAKKSVKVLQVNTPDPADEDVPIPLWKQNVVASSEYDTTSHEFTNNEIGSVRTDQSSATTPAANPVFTATPHSQE